MDGGGLRCLGVGLKHVLSFLPLPGEMIQYFLNGLKSPTSCEPPLFSCLLRLGLEGPGHGNMFTPGKTT